MSEKRVARAEALMAEWRYDDALAIWREICAESWPDAAHRVAMATCLVELGAAEEALFELETALALDSSVIADVEDDVRFSALLHRFR